MQTQLQSNTQGKSPPTFLTSTFETTRDSFLQSLKKTLVAVAKLFICVSSWTDGKTERVWCSERLFVSLLFLLLIYIFWGPSTHPRNVRVFTRGFTKCQVIKCCRIITLESDSIFIRIGNLLQLSDTHYLSTLASCFCLTANHPYVCLKYICLQKPTLRFKHPHHL